VTIIVTIGGQPVESIPAAIPSNARIASFLPYAQIMPEIDLLITNGGYGSRSRTLYPAVVIALNTGMRSIEIRSLRWTQVDLAAKMLRVSRSKTDAGAGRMIPLNARATVILRDWAANFPSRGPEDYVFPSERYGQNGSPYAIDPSKPMGSFKEGWEAARKRSKIQCRFHDLRHPACTRLLGGVPFALLAQIMGWSASSTVKMAKRYGHVGDSSLRQAMALLDQRVA
jgi:integrase